MRKICMFWNDVFLVIFLACGNNFQAIWSKTSKFVCPWCYRGAQWTRTLLQKHPERSPPEIKVCWSRAFGYHQHGCVDVDVLWCVRVFVFMTWKVMLLHSKEGEKGGQERKFPEALNHSSKSAKASRSWPSLAFSTAWRSEGWIYFSSKLGPYWYSPECKGSRSFQACFKSSSCFSQKSPPSNSPCFFLVIFGATSFLAASIAVQGAAVQDTSARQAMTKPSPTPSPKRRFCCILRQSLSDKGQNRGTVFQPRVHRTTMLYRVYHNLTYHGVSCHPNIIQYNPATHKHKQKVKRQTTRDGIWKCNHTQKKDRNWHGKTRNICMLFCQQGLLLHISSSSQSASAAWPAGPEWSSFTFLWG